MNRTHMFYDKKRDRWAVNLKGRLYGLHCGECFDLAIGGRTLSCRLELDRHWFVAMEKVCLNLRTQDTYDVIL